MKKCYLTWSKSSVDNKTIFKHLDKLSEGKLQFHTDFELIDDIKATRKILQKTINPTSTNNRIRKKTPRTFKVQGGLKLNGDLHPQDKKRNTLQVLCVLLT